MINCGNRIVLVVVCATAFIVASARTSFADVDISSDIYVYTISPFAPNPVVMGYNTTAAVVVRSDNPDVQEEMVGSFGPPSVTWYAACLLGGEYCTDYSSIGFGSDPTDGPFAAIVTASFSMCGNWDVGVCASVSFSTEHLGPLYYGTAGVDDLPVTVLGSGPREVVQTGKHGTITYGTPVYPIPNGADEYNDMKIRDGAEGAYTGAQSVTEEFQNSWDVVDGKIQGADATKLIKNGVGHTWTQGAELNGAIFIDEQAFLPGGNQPNGPWDYGTPLKRFNQRWSLVQQSDSQPFTLNTQYVVEINPTRTRSTPVTDNAAVSRTETNWEN